MEKVHTGTYRAQPERRIFIEKDDGRKRALGLLAIEIKWGSGSNYPYCKEIGFKIQKKRDTIL